MAHAMSAQGVKNALLAGVVSIEHGCLLDEEAVALMLERGAYLVPTLVAPHDVIAGVEKGASLPASIVDKARTLIQRHQESFRAALTAGVHIAMGTDSGVGAHGGNLRELALMVECGMTPMRAIEASTRVPAELLGWSSRVGTLEPGKFADVIAVSGDPLAGIGLLSRPENIRVVMKQGELVRALDQETRVAVAAGHTDG